MSASSQQASSTADVPRHLLLFDGECGLCDRTVQLVLRRDRARRFDFAALQSSEAATMLTSLGVTPVHVFSTGESR
jgi:predicted DCC family thiol-disulfide oxidoreductase YuxK